VTELRVHAALLTLGKASGYVEENELLVVAHDVVIVGTRIRAGLVAIGAGLFRPVGTRLVADFVVSRTGPGAFARLAALEGMKQAQIVPDLVEPTTRCFWMFSKMPFVMTMMFS
jgi:hypothetical protein